MTNTGSPGERAAGATANHVEGHGLPRGWTIFSGLERVRGQDISGELLSGRFELIRPIGEGGMSVVYLARDRQLPRLAAVKVLRACEPLIEQRFLDEVELLATLTHPGLVAPLGRGRTADGRLYMAMEYVRGESLRERLDERGPLAWRRAVQVGIQVGEVLAMMHDAGVIHRDIKPANIMLSDGPTLTIKVLDLGVAKRLPGGVRSASPRVHTEAGVAVGTPLYQPPEAGLVPADPRLDVFGLAATVFELCTGERPDRGAHRPIPDASVELDAVLMDALALDIDARTPTIASLLTGFARALAGRQRLLDGRYEVLRSLGVGGRGEVVLAHHRAAGRDVALKRLHPARQNGEEQARMRREARVLAELRHPAFPTLYDVHEHGGQLYLAMERVAGERASSFVQRPLSPSHVLAIGVQLAGAIIALHELGVVHRDIHGGNVLIDFAAGLEARPSVRLLDLGMCELLPAWFARVHRYGTPPEQRTVLGTGGLEQFAWTAPEARRERMWTEKCDVWSVGLLLFQLLTGRRPSPPGSDEPPVSPRAWVSCSTELAHALLAALHPDASLRLDAPGLLARLTEAVDVSDAEERDPASAGGQRMRDSGSR